MKIERNEDGTVTVRGGGYFWATLDAAGRLTGHPEGCTAKTAWRGFLAKARARAAVAFLAT